jgi:hypothetical protein
MSAPAVRRSVATITLLLAAFHGEAALYKCQSEGRTVYQQMPCVDGQLLSVTKSGRGPESPVPATESAPAAAPRRPTFGALSPSPTDAPGEAGSLGNPEAKPIDRFAQTCLDWYRPLLRDPQGAYFRDARMELNVLTLTIYATNGLGGYAPKQAACEIKQQSGDVDEGWTKIHAKRKGWIN